MPRIADSARRYLRPARRAAHRVALATRVLVDGPEALAPPVREEPEEPAPGRDWFHDHYVSVVDEIRDFLAGDGLSLAGLDVIDVGCGDGIVDAGITTRLAPRMVVGFDIVPVDTERLAALVHASTGTDLPPNLYFETCSETSLPCASGAADWVISWSAFEHISDPAAVVSEMRRVVRDDGKLFLQLYPFYASAWGSHLEAWFPEPFVQHRLTPDEVADHVLASDVGDEATRHRMVDAYRTLNRITLDDLQCALWDGGFDIVKAELLTSATHLPATPGTRHRLSDLLINGVKLIGMPR